ncbi:MAG: hypothetical protein ABI685_09510 [Ferruginibacter sp.]
MFSLFKKKTISKNPEEKFWDWFIKNKEKIEKFIDSDHSNYSIYNKLTVEIQKYNTILVPELTKTEDDKYVLIITPDGIKGGVEPTKKLAEVSPEIDNWVIVKFRQPTDKITLNFKGLEYPSSDIEILPEIDHDKEIVDIHVFIRNMNKDEGLYQSLAFLYLDHILGEFNSITKIGYIDFHHLDENKQVENGITLLELRNLIADNLY